MDISASRTNPPVDIVENLQEFYSRIQEYYDELFPLDERVVRFYQGMEQEYRQSQRGDAIPMFRFLGIGCGTGNLENRLVTLGFDVTGIDKNADMVATAQRRMKRSGASIRFFEMSSIDMRRFLKASSFNAVSSLGNILPFIGDETLIRKFFHDSKALLAPGGALVVELANFDAYRPNETIRLRDKSSVRVLLARSFTPADDGKMLLDVMLELGNGSRIVLQKRTHILPIHSQTAEQWAREAGFTTMNRYSGFDKEPWSAESESMVLVFS